MSSGISLSSPAFFNAALLNLSNATQRVSTNVAQLSSGNRLVTAGTDVAAFSISSLMQSQLAGLKSAQSNAAQGNSFLQVAAGGLQQVQSILNNLQSVATQANTAGITSIQRQALQLEFSGLLSQIDSIAGTTSFNSIKLLDGTVSGTSAIGTTATNATQATATLTFSDLTGTETVKLNGVTFTGNTEFSTAGGTNSAVAALKNALNASTDARISQATYSSSGNTLTITHKSGGSLGNQYFINQGGSSSTFVNTGTANSVAGYYTLAGGANNGLNIGSVSASGTIGDALVNTQAQTAASVTLTYSGSVTNNDVLQIDKGDGTYVSFTFKNTPVDANKDIQIGATTAATLQNAVAKLSQYAGTDNFGTNQLNYTASGSTLTLTNKIAGNATNLSGGNLAITGTFANGTLSGSSFNNGVNTGVNTTGVTNSAFTGTLDGFTVTYNSADNVTASVTVGDKTYTATISDTTPGVLTTTRFSSTSGGYFDVQLSATGQTVSDQPTADTYAAHLNAAFSSLTFYQNRNVSNFSGATGLAGATAKLQMNDFSNPEAQEITVAAPTTQGGDATITVTLSGQDYRSASGLGSSLGAYQTITLTSTTDSNQKITLTNGSTPNDFSTTDAAATFESALRTAFGLNESGNGLDFQIGTAPTDTINITIGNLRTSKLFAGSTPDVNSQSNAAAAESAITAAQNRVTSILANVGSLQTGFESALANLQSMSMNIDNARSQLADTDIPSTSTQYAMATVQANAATAVLAQTLQLKASLLEVLKSQSH